MVKKMIKLEDDEKEILEAYEAGQLQSIATKSELEKIKAAARATGSIFGSQKEI